MGGALIKRLVLGIALAMVAMVLVPTSYMYILAATSYTDSWDVAGDLAGWRANTAWTNVEVSDTGGNPGGYLFTESDGSSGPSTYYAGALTEKEEFTGDYSFASTVQISVDLKFLEGTSYLSGAYLRFRYQSSQHNGWRYLLTADPETNEWVTYEIVVDPNWTNIEATSAGWLQEGGSPDFSVTMADVYTAEVRLEGTNYMSVGIDNFTADLGSIIREVPIDIKPGNFPNSVNPKSKGVIPVAILTTSTAAGDSVDFDATQVDASTVEFGPSKATMTHNAAHLEDVDGDGDIDMVLHFKTQDTGIQCGDTQAILTGETVSGQAITGSDTIKTVGCK